MARFAWVTLATNDSYSLGALVLGHSLRRVNTAHQLVVLITPSVTEAMKTQLSAVYNVVKVVDVLDSKDADNLALLARPELGITFTKLHCWRLTEFDKCVFLDADTLVLQNSDELFDREELSAAPDAGWPDCFNSGVFVFKPSSDTFKALIEFALIHGSFDGGDQGLLNLFFNDWATKDIKKHLPFVYNMCSTATYSYLPAFKKFGQGLKIIHFIGAAKPWLQPFNTETSLVQVSGESHHIREFVQFWWDMFCTSVHPSLSSEMAGLAGALASLTLGSPLSAEQGALEEHLRRQGWEQGNIDYMGKDSFANIWKKICGTLSGVSEPIASSEVPTPAPVAPIAAPLFVSSVEMSPAGPIDTSPPASYAPVSALTPTVVASDTEAVSKAAPAETSTVAPQPQSPSVTEVASAEVTPSATAVSSQVSTEKAAADSQLVVPSTIEPATQSASESVAKTNISIVPVSQPEPLTGTAPDQSVIVLKECPKEAKTPPTTPVTDSAPVLESLLSQAVVAPLPPAADPPAKADVVSDASPSPTAIQTLPPAKEDISPVESITSEVISTMAPAKTEVIPSAVQDKPLEVPSEVAEIVSSPPIKAETAPEAAKLDNVPASIEQTPTSVVTEVLPPQVALPVGAATTENQVVQGVASPPAQPVPEPIATTEVSTEPVTLPPAAETLASVPPTTTALATSQASPVPTTPAPVQQDTPIVIEPTPAPTSVSVAEIPASVPIEEKPAPVDPTPPASAATPVTPTPAPVEATPTPVQPDTPTVTEPTPPTSPPAVAVESPLAAKLQVDTEVPATPPIEASATQPAAAATGSSEEPPVPPKRKGGSKASQEAKNQKGGKPTKGKK